MRRWTAREDAILERYGAMGVVAVCRIIREQTGKVRTESACQHRASRIGVSLFERATCPECGRTVKRLRRSGLCERCHHLSFCGAEGAARLVEPTEEQADSEALARRRRNAERKARCRRVDSVKAGNQKENPRSA